MLRKNPKGQTPEVSTGAYIDQTAVICGRVIIEENVYVGPYVVIRADEEDAQGNIEPLIIRKGCNIQDGVVIHSKSGARMEIGENTSIAHRAIVHAPCTIGSNVFIGFNSVVFNSTIHDGCVIQHSAVVDGCTLPPQRHVPSLTRLGPCADLNTLSAVDAADVAFAESVVAANHELVKGYKALSNEF